MSEIDPKRARFLGNLICEARESASASAEECAQVLGMPVEAYIQAEEGQALLDLPQLEVLAMYLDLPMAYFWDGTQSEKSQTVDYGQYMALRQRIIGVTLQQARVDAGRSVQQLADEAGLTTEQIEAYEKGAEPIPYLQLELLADVLAASLNDFTVEKHGPLGKHEQVLARRQRFNSLPDDVQAFVVEPGNLSYLQTAMRLSAMDVDQLRGIAEGILDITF
ncbi:MAG TPA: helix-turn-helix transcriptional regulator [Anaerolineae bacterium]|jgi:transcriptional regulator with XRE-family HTH domain|nr:helix-turn-helix transcriptional regulator [Anaerolineae bacterium]